MSDAFGLSLLSLFCLFNQSVVRRWMSSNDTQCTFRCISHLFCWDQICTEPKIFVCRAYVSGTERRSYPLSSHLHLRDSRSPIRSRSNDLQLGSRFTHALTLMHLIFWPPTRGSTPLTGTFDPLRSAAEPDISGWAGTCRSQLSLIANKGPPAPTN